MVFFHNAWLTLHIWMARDKIYYTVGKIAKKAVWRSTFLLIQHSKYSVMLSKVFLQTASSTIFILPTGLEVLTHLIPFGLC